MKLQKSIIAIIALFIFASAASAQLQYRNALDFDGDHKADLTTIRQYFGTGAARSYEWYTRTSSNGAMRVVLWGTNNDGSGRYDDPRVFGDYDGDGKADYAVARRPPNNNGNYVWYIRNSSNGSVSYDTFGFYGAPIYPGANQGDKPFAADFDGDGKTDVAVVRYNGLTNTTPPTSLTWYWRSSINGSLGYYTANINYPGNCYPWHGDFDGDGKSDFTQYCAGGGTNGQIIWDIAYSSDKSRRQIQWGLGPDYVTGRPADFDGDGKSDLLAVRQVPVPNSPNQQKNYVWYIRRSSDGAMQTGYFGATYTDNTNIPIIDIPFPNDYDGDNKADFAVVRYSNSVNTPHLYWYIQQSTNNQINVIGWGLSDDELGFDGF